MSSSQDNIDRRRWATRHASPSASIVQIDAGKYYLLIAAAYAFAAAAIVISGMAWWVADKAEREARMGEFYMNEVDKSLAKAGVPLPEGGYQSFKRHHAKEI